MRIDDLMSKTGVAFGTSGARGLVAAMTDQVCYLYVLGFLQYLREQGELGDSGEVGIAGDLRPSSPRIMAACAEAVADFGLRPRYFGCIPTPALAAIGIAHRMPTMMVTGSHIPDDRNGIKFNRPDGEILKEHEAGIRAQDVPSPDDRFTADGAFVAPMAMALPPEDPSAYEAYIRRYLDFYPAAGLAGVRVGLYEHSTVARGAFDAVLTALGAEVVRLGRSETFVPVDTEAIRAEDLTLAREWAAGGAFDALVSADGDGDRPLVADESGTWLRGDIAGVLCARHLGARYVVTPVSSNSVVERCGRFEGVVRTRIGSPYVIAAMEELRRIAPGPVVGYEANGGFMTASDIERTGRRLPALPTRDALIVVLSLLFDGPARRRPISQLLAEMPERHTYSDRLVDFPSALSDQRLAELTRGDDEENRQAVDALFAADFGPAVEIDTTDGLRITFASGTVAHLRPSGNAPELRAYTEADSVATAREMNRRCLEILSGWRD
ncbi:phosphomannomutase [Thioalkalicoccus limnaeus]|uniref:Phosphomannomutase n=1 Tax=Thioalkalicoccus limnaeus TaxID=120681 RepID=A0ABV4B998_9GAMM